MEHTQMEINELNQSIIDEAILLAQNVQLPDWQSCIAKIDRRIELLHDQARHQPVIPTELQDAYRSEIDGLSLENMKLHAKLDQTKEALERARNAYMAEREQTRILQTRLNELERRLLDYLDH